MAKEIEETEETALVVEIPAADGLIGPWRDRLDPFAAMGVPAHLTVLFPFLPVDEIDNQVTDALTRLFAGHAAFDYCFDRIGWFANTVLWLAPADPDPFERLTDAVVGLFPEHPPYGGIYTEVIPHLTLGHRCDPAELQDAAPAVERLLPFQGRAEEVSLLVPVQGRYRRQQTFRLGR